MTNECGIISGKYIPMFKKLTSLILVCAISLFGYGDVLCWQVNENTNVDGISIRQFLVPYPSTDDAWSAARVKLVSSDGTSSTILKIWYDNPDDPPSRWEDGDWGVEPCDTGSGYWETGIVQSDTGYHTIGTIQGALHGETPSYPPEVMESLFIMELGYNEWNDGVGDYVWKTLAESAPELYRDLVYTYMYESGDIRPSPDHVWTPNFYTTPEPSTFLLCIIGFGLLLLKRKTNGES